MLVGKRRLNATANDATMGIALGVMVHEAGGEIRLTGEQLSKLPLGLLHWGFFTGTTEIRYIPSEAAKVMTGLVDLALACIIHTHYDGAYELLDARVRALPNGRLLNHLDGDDAVLVYELTNIIIPEDDLPTAR